MQWYRTGTITITNGSATVTGASTLWSDVGTLNPGDILNGPDGKLYEILTINSNTGITLNSVYLGTSLSAQAYSIMPIGLLPSTLAQSVKTTLATANTALASTVRYDINSMGLSLTQQQNARTNIAALSALDVGQGYLALSVAGSANVTLTAVQASSQVIGFTGVLTGNISVIVPNAARGWVFYNGTTGAFTITVKTAAGAGVSIQQGKQSAITCDGTGCWDSINALNSGLSVTGVVSASGGTATTVLSYAGSNGVVGTTSAGNLQIITGGTVQATVDTNGNLGLGVVPSAWNAGVKSIQIGNSGSLFSYSGGLELTANAYLNGSGVYTYVNTGFATLTDQLAGQYRWFSAPSGAAGAAISFTQAMTLDASGNLMVGATSTGGLGVTIFPASTIQQDNNNGASGFLFTGFYRSGVGIGGITQNGTTAVLYNTTSDYRLKTDVTSITGTEALARLAAVRPVDFTWVSDGSKDAGFIAHEFQATYSRNVTGEKDGTEQQEYEVTPAVPATHDADGTELTAAIPAVMGARTVPKYQQMDNSAAVPDLVAAVTYLAAQVASIQASLVH